MPNIPSVYNQCMVTVTYSMHGTLLTAVHAREKYLPCIIIIHHLVLEDIHLPLIKCSLLITINISLNVSVYIGYRSLHTVSLKSEQVQYFKFPDLLCSGKRKIMIIIDEILILSGLWGRTVA